VRRLATLMEKEHTPSRLFPLPVDSERRKAAASASPGPGE
jgi:hypothetical protein